MSSAPDFSLRDPEEGVNELFHQRWSPRTFKSMPIPKENLRMIFDAARWTPSCYNEQPWLFITSTEKTHHIFANLLLEGNQTWAKSAPVIGFVIANRHFQRNGKENGFFEFDSGAAWMSLTMQARKLGLYTHGMGGVKFDEVYTALNIDVNQKQVLCAFALGELEEAENAEERVTASPRKPLADIWQEF